MVISLPFESPLDSKEIKPVKPKGNQLWIFIGRADAETLILWSPDAKNRLIGKDPDVEKDWRQEEKGMTENEMVGWHHQLNGHEFEQAPGVSDGQGSLGCCSPWGLKELDKTERLNWTEDPLYYLLFSPVFARLFPSNYICQIIRNLLSQFSVFIVFSLWL